MENIELHFLNGELAVGQNIMVASRASNGRVGWTIQKLLDVTARGNKILAFALESKKAQFTFMGANNGQADLANWQIEDRKGVSVTEIATVLEEEKQKGMEANVLYIDNIDYLVSSEDNKPLKKRGDVQDALVTLFQLCEENNLSLLVGKGIAEEKGKESNAQPTLKDIKVNSATKDLFSTIIGLYRDEVYNKESVKKNRIEIFQLKTDNYSGEEVLEEEYNLRGNRVGASDKAS